MEYSKNKLNSVKSYNKESQKEIEYKGELEQVRSELNTVKAKLASLEEQQRIASHHASLKELHEEKDKNKDMFSSDSGNNSDNSDSEGKGSSPANNSETSSSNGKDIVSGGSVFAKSPRSSTKTPQEPANDSNVMGMTPIQK